MAQARNDETCIPAALFPNKGPDIASPSSFILPLFLYFFFIWLHRERERMRGISLPAHCQLFGKVSSARFSMESGDGCLCSSIHSWGVSERWNASQNHLKRGDECEDGACSHAHVENVTLRIFDDGCICVFLCVMSLGCVLVEHNGSLIKVLSRFYKH